MHAAHRGQARALVASPAGLLRPTLTRRLFETRVVSLRAGEDLLPEILLEALDEGGYRREDPVVAPGQVARRGGILDVFPPDQGSPVRLEFLGDTLESLRRFDPETQRTTGALDALEVLPIADVFATRSVVAELRERLPRRFADRRELPTLLERLERGLVPDEVVELLPLVPDTTVPVWAHLDGFAVVVLDPEAVHAEAEGSTSGRARRRTGGRTRSRSSRRRRWSAWTRCARACRSRPPSTCARWTPTGASWHVASRPVGRYAGDLRRMASDLRARAGRSVLFLGNQGRADRLTDLLHRRRPDRGRGRGGRGARGRAQRRVRAARRRHCRCWPTATSSPKRSTCTRAIGAPGCAASSRTSAT